VFLIRDPSFASTKSVVHWFQIMRNGHFTMYDDDAYGFISPPTRNVPSGPTAYYPVRFPTKNISSPIVLIYGDQDSLVDINSMLRELPESRTLVKCLRVSTLIYAHHPFDTNIIRKGYEHLDILWGEDIDKDVFPTVIETLRHYSQKSEKTSLICPGDGTSTVHLVE
jgi:lysosomal acid lipase/cholesteryl ester hydrolase